MTAGSNPPLRERLQDALEGVSSSTGDDFFRALVRDLATSLDVRYALIAEVVPTPSGPAAKGLAGWIAGELRDTDEVDPTGTPCADVLTGRTVFFPRDVGATYPRLLELTEPEVQSYLGLPILDASGAVIGRICAIDVEPMVPDLDSEWTLRMFAARAAAEIERRRAESALRDSEERFRATFEHAAIGIAHVGLDKTFMRVNETLCDILGYDEYELA